MSHARNQLIRLARRAYSGERAAALAYRGHARAVRSPQERREIAAIERDEWDHRTRLGRMLAQLGAPPDGFRDRRAALVGTALGLLCHVAGWFLPMYAAGRLERRNIREYEEAAKAAIACGQPEWARELLRMAEVEWEHERYFREKARSHRWGSWIPVWPPPGPKEALRLSME